jgi:hypothetical protein
MLYTDMIDGVLAKARGCPRELATDAVRDTCIEWCKDTLCLTEGSTIVFDSVDVPNEELDQVVHAIVDALIDDERVLLTHMNDDRLADLSSFGYDYAITYADPANLHLTVADVAAEPTVAAPITCELLIAFGPGPTSTEVPALLWQRYSEWLRSGALYRVLEEPGNSWTNAKSAAYHKTRYEAEMARVAQEQAMNRENGRRTRTRPAYI